MTMQSVSRISSGVIRHRHVLVLGLLALLAAAGYIAQQKPLQTQRLGAEFIHMAARQRALVEHINLLAERWVDATTDPQRQRCREEMVADLRKLEVVHDRMLQGKIGGPDRVQQRVRERLFESPAFPHLQQQMQRFIAAARAVAALPPDALQGAPPELAQLRDLDAEAALFRALDEFVLAAQRVVERGIRRSYEAALWILGLTLTALVMTAFFIFRPTEQMVRHELERLNEINARLEIRMAEGTAAGERQAQALARSEEQIRQLSRAVEQSPSVVLITDTEGRIEYVNPKFTELTGYTFEEVRGQNPRILKSGRMPQQEYKQIWEAVTAGHEWRGEILNRKKNGELFWGRALISPIRDAGGRITHYLEVMEDITEQKRAEEERWRAQAFLNSIIENIPDMIFVKDAEHLRFVRFNRAGEELVGFTREEMIGKSDYDFFPKEEADFFTMKDREVLAGGKLVNIPEEVIQTRRHGLRILHTKKMPIMDESGKPQYLLGISEDITERRRAEERQRAMTEGLRAVLHIADELIACTDVDELFHRAVDLARERLGLERCGIMVQARDCVRGTYGTNRKGETVDEHANRIEMTELWRERFQGRQPNEPRWVVSEEPYYEWNGEEMVKFGRGWVAITTIQSSDREVVGVFSNDAAISGAEVDTVKQEIVAVFCSLLGNIVARKRAESERRASEEKQREFMERSDRLNSLGLLAAGMAHEINNPLQGMLSHLQAVQRALPADAAAQKSLGMVQRGIETIAALVRKLLVMGSTGETAGGVTICSEVVEFVIQLLESQFKKARIKIIKEYRQPKITLAMPRRELIQVLLNLMINARDALAGGGTVKITCDADDEWGMILVQDSGPGIAPDVISRIFTPFFTTKGTDGTGLGLSVAESLVRSSGGAILVESAPGQGTTFTLKIPLARSQAS